MHALRAKIDQLLNDPFSRGAKWVNGILIFFIVVSVTLIPLYFMPFSQWLAPQLELFERITMTIFTAEYLLRIWSSKKPLRYIFSWGGFIDFVVIIPFYLARLDITDVAPELFLVFRLARVIKMARICVVSHGTDPKLIDMDENIIHILPGERIERVAQRHPITFLFHLALPLALTAIAMIGFALFQGGWISAGVAIFFLLFALLTFLQAWLDYNYDVIFLTTRRIILQNRELLGISHNDVSYEAITNVKPYSFGLGYIFGFGDIKIDTAAANGTMVFESVSDPQEVVSHIVQNRQRVLAEENNGGASMHQKAVPGARKTSKENTEEA